MKPSTIRALAFGAAAAVAAMVLLLAADPQRTEVGVAVTPFGLGRVVVVHVAAALMLSWVLANWATLAWPILRARWWAVVWILIAVAVAVTTPLTAAILGRALHSLGGGVVTRLVVRSAWCVLLQLPWMLAAEAVVVDRTAKQHSPLTLLNRFALGLAIAVVVPGSYLNKLIDEQATLLGGHCDNGRLVSARHVAWTLCDWGSRRPLEDCGHLLNPPSSDPATPGPLLTALQRRIVETEQAVEQPLPADATTDARLRRAQRLGMLEQRDAARTVLRPIAGEHGAAALMMARFANEERRWARSNEWLRIAVDATPALPAAMQFKAFDAMAFNHQKLKQADEAIACYEEAIDRLPKLEAELRKRLANFFEMEGRPGKAIEQHAIAHRLKPKAKEYAMPADGVVARVLKNNTPVGLFSPTASRHEEK